MADNLLLDQVGLPHVLVLDVHLNVTCLGRGIILRIFYDYHFFAAALLLEHVGLPLVLDLAVHLVNFFGWMSQGGHSEQFLFFALFYQSTPSYLKVRGGVVAHVIIVSAPVQRIGFLGFLDLV